MKLQGLLEVGNIGSIHSPNEQNIEEFSPEVWREVSDCEELMGVTYSG